jgi:hypothetical protein
MGRKRGRRKERGGRVRQNGKWKERRGGLLN